MSGTWDGTFGRDIGTGHWDDGVHGTWVRLLLFTLLPKRERKPNIKYSSEEYDLSAVSAMNRKVLLFGMHIIHGTDIKATKLKHRRKSV